MSAFSLISIYKIRAFSAPNLSRLPFSISHCAFRPFSPTPTSLYSFTPILVSKLHSLSQSPLIPSPKVIFFSSPSFIPIYRIFSNSPPFVPPHSIPCHFCRNLSLPTSLFFPVSIPTIRMLMHIFSFTTVMGNEKVGLEKCNDSLIDTQDDFVTHGSFPSGLVFTKPPFKPTRLIPFGIHRNLSLPISPFQQISTPTIGVCLRLCSFATSNGTEMLNLDKCNNSLTDGSEKCDDSLIDISNDRLTHDADKVYSAITENLSADQCMEMALALVGVDLTTELVNEILQRLRFEEKTAFRFFTWVGHQEGYSHETQTFNRMIDILSSTRYKAKQFAIVCDILDYMKRKGKNSVPVDVLIMILRKYAEKHLTHLQKFTKKKKIRVKTQPEINAFNLLLDSLCKCSLVEEADVMVKKVKSKITPDANTYNILFFGWCRVKNPIKGMKVLEEMIEIGHTPDNFTYNTAIDTFCRAGMVSEAIDLFEFMRTKGSTMSSPTAKTYCIMIVALAKSGRMDDCFRFMADMRNSGVLPDVSTYKELIEGMCSAGKFDEAYKFLEEMGTKGYPPDIVTYNCFLKVLCDLKEADEALRFFGRMAEVGCVPSVHTFNMLIAMFFEMGEVDGAFDTWHEMDKRGFPRDVDTYCVMIEGLFDCGQAADACFLLEDVVNKGMKLPFQKFDTFLLQLSKMGDLCAIHRLSEHMRKFYNPAMARRFAVSQKRKSMGLRRE